MQRYVTSFISLILVAICFAGAGRADDLPVIRVGLLQFGTVNWEVTVMRDGLDTAHGFKLEPVNLADKDAATIALLSKTVDVIVTDWLWVARQRADGRDFTFVPFSTAVGGVMAKPTSGLRSIADLAGHRLGIGGGPDDKSWLLLRAYAQKTAGIDLSKRADIQFAAPPILNELASRGKLDAVLNFWQFNAQLKAKGFDEIVSVRTILPKLGLDRPPPLLGWVFHEGWAAKNPRLAQGLFDASFAAKDRMLKQDTVWQMLRPQMKAPDDALFEALKAGYREGIPTSYGQSDIDAAQAAFRLMATVDRKSVGGLAELPPGTFWAGYVR